MDPACGRAPSWSCSLSPLTPRGSASTCLSGGPHVTWRSLLVSTTFLLHAVEKQASGLGGRSPSQVQTSKGALINEKNKQISLSEEASPARAA